MDKRKKGRTTSKIFVLDTSVILFDHLAIKNFQEHDIVIPITVLEELDQFKKGNDTVNFESRQFIRFIDGISLGQNLNNWVKISDDKMYNIIEFFKINTENLVNIFPNIILNSVNYKNVSIPSYWGSQLSA